MMMGLYKEEWGDAVPEGGQQGGVDGVPIVHVEVVPAALGGKVVEPQSEDGVGPETQTHVNRE